MNTNKFEITKRSFGIKNGPSRDLLIDSLKYAYDKGKVLPVDFSIAVGYTTPLDDPGCAFVAMKIESLTITSLEHEDGSGYSFNLAGYCRATLSPWGEVKPYKFKAYYNAKVREGRIEFTD
jgi:hypothetical protein